MNIKLRFVNIKLRFQASGGMAFLNNLAYDAFIGIE